MHHKIFFKGGLELARVSINGDFQETQGENNS